MIPSLVLHNIFLSFVIHSSCVSCLSFCTSVHMCYVVGAEWVHTSCHYSCHGVPAQPCSGPLSSAKTGRYLLATWRYLDTRWTWAFSHIRQNESSIFFYYYLSCSFEQLPLLWHLSFFSFHYASVLMCVLYFTPLSTAKTHKHLLVTWRCHRNESFMGIFTQWAERVIYFFYCSSNTHLVPSCNFLSFAICPSFLSLYFCSHVCTLQQELSGCIYLATVLVIKSLHGGILIYTMSFCFIICLHKQSSHLLSLFIWILVYLTSL